MNSHHPELTLLKKFAEGSLDGAVSCVVSAHVEHCSQCLKSVKQLEQKLSAEIFNVAAPDLAVPENEAWQKIALKLRTTKKLRSKFDDSSEIEVLGLKFALPRALRKFVSQPLKWMAFGGGGRICKLGQENGRSLFLIYLSSNQEVPLHSHAGTEHSYVVSGSYSADGQQFNTGDFSTSSQDVVHSPKADSEIGCLILSSVENRLNFIQGWLRPLNRLLWWVLDTRLKRMP